MKEYLQNRINELRKADSKLCNERWDMSQPLFKRQLAREYSNSVTMARQELEQALKYLEENEK